MDGRLWLPKGGRQVRVLRGWLSRRPEARRRLSDAVTRVETIRRQALQGGDVASLRGWEGAAARIYFSGLAAAVVEVTLHDFGASVEG